MDWIYQSNCYKRTQLFYYSDTVLNEDKVCSVNAVQKYYKREKRKCYHLIDVLSLIFILFYLHVKRLKITLYP